MYSIRFEDITKRWPGQPPALDHLTMTIEAGEMFSIVGPSGCGKTTALRILAGLEKPSGGKVVLGGRNITRFEARRRHFGFVSQQNQLMNHLTSGGNISFPLEMRGVKHSGRSGDLVREEAARFGIEHLLDRRPKTLSEGQRRRVQLARAVISSPSTLLMDEPLGYLEDQIRLQLRTEILRIHRERGLTTLIATATQHDAMAMSDRIAVLFDGMIDQIGAAYDVYHRPATSRVAAFFGEPGMNVIPATVRTTALGRDLELFGRSVPITAPALDRYGGRTVLVGVRPDDVELGSSVPHALPGRVGSVETLGRTTYVGADVASGATINCSVPGRTPRLGTTLDLGVRPDRLHIFDPATDMAIHHPRPPAG